MNRPPSPRHPSNLLVFFGLAGALWLAAAGGVGGAGRAEAQIPVTDVAHIGANVYWHALHYAQLALQLAQQYRQLINQVEQIRYQLLALRKLADPRWRDLSRVLAEIDAAARSGKALGYALSDVEGEFRHSFPGWQRWSEPGAVQAQTERALDTMRAGLGAAARQGRELAAGEATLARIREQMGATAGHQQALEQLATLAAFQAQEQLLTRQALAVEANLTAVASGYWLNREAQGQATWTALAAESALAAGRNTSQGWRFQPAWWPFY